MRSGIAGAVAIAILSLTLNGCGDRSDTAGAGAKQEETMAQPLSPEKQAKLDACLAQAVPPPWSLVRTQPIADHLSVTIEARSDELQLPHRPIDMRRQQYVEIGVGQGSLRALPTPDDLRARIARGLMQPRTEVAGIAAAEFAPFVPYQDGDWTLFLNIAGEEQCSYRDADGERPNPFVQCWAKRGEYTASLTFPHDAIGHLPRLFVDTRSLLSRMTSCFDGMKE